MTLSSLGAGGSILAIANEDKALRWFDWLAHVHSQDVLMCSLNQQDHLCVENPRAFK